MRELREQVRELHEAIDECVPIGSALAPKRRNCAANSMRSAPEQRRETRFLSAR